MTEIAMRRTTGSWFRVLLTAACCLTGLGCIEQRILIHVEPDGSGYLLASLVMPRQTVDMLVAQRENRSGDDETRDPGLPILSDRYWKFMGRMLGSGVTFVNGSAVEDPAGMGYAALYRFTSVNGLSVDVERLNQMAQAWLYSDDAPSDLFEDAEDMVQDMGRGNYVIEFRHAVATNAKPAELQIRLPQYPDADDGDDEADADDDVAVAAEQADADLADDDEGDDEAFDIDYDMAEYMYARGGAGSYRRSVRYYRGRSYRSAGDVLEGVRGLAIQLTVEVGGTPVSVAPAHAGARVTNRVDLVNIDVSRLMRTPVAKKALERAYNSGNANELPTLFGYLAGLPGVVETNRTVTVRFRDQPKD